MSNSSCILPLFELVKHYHCLCDHSGFVPNWHRFFIYCPNFEYSLKMPLVVSVLVVISTSTHFASFIFLSLDLCRPLRDVCVLQS